MLKHKKTLNELIEENKRELIGKSGIGALIEQPKKANETPQVDLLYRDINMLRGELERVKAENERLRRSGCMFTLIVSQFYHSRHFFIVKHDENFLDNARAFTKELVKYKRNEEAQRRYEQIHENNPERDLGDLHPQYCGDGHRSRYNINDSGDIYFIQHQYVNYLMWNVMEYRETTLRESRGYQKKSLLEKIDNHHNYEKVKEIVEKYFEIV